MREGGIPSTFSSFIVYGTRGKGWIGNMVAMFERKPYANSPCEFMLR